LIRLNARARITAFLEPPEWLPAAGQGAIAVQIRSDDDEMRELMSLLDHASTSVATNAERAFLAALDGGCQVPIGALASFVTPDELVLHGFVSDLRGKNFVRGSRRVSATNPVKSGVELAAEMRSRGASSLLTELRAAENVTPPQPE
jgi:hydroxymethylbilane synthase